MNKAIAMPALVLASMFVATSAWAQWAQMPAGNPHKLRKTIDIRSEDKDNWNIRKVVTLKAGKHDQNCKWAAAPSPIPSLDKATLAIDTDSAGNTSMYLVFSDKHFVRRQVTFGGPAGEQTWLSSTPKDDWNYYVLFEDTKPGAKPKTPIDKRYHVEIFPPEGVDTVNCDPERPDHAVTIVSVPNRAKGLPCQAGSGAGNEPH
jgi:hypothetical protein